MGEVCELAQLVHLEIKAVRCSCVVGADGQVILPDCPEVKY